MCLIPRQLAAIDEPGYNCIRSEHIDKLTRSLMSTGLAENDRVTFDYHCHKSRIDPNTFTQSDFNTLQDRLNE